MRLRQKPKKIRLLILALRPTPTLVLLQKSTRKNQQVTPVRLAILVHLKNQLSHATLARPPTRVRRTSNDSTRDVSRTTGG